MEKIKCCKTCVHAEWTKNKAGARITTASKLRPYPGWCKYACPGTVGTEQIHGNCGTNCSAWKGRK